MILSKLISVMWNTFFIWLRTRPSDYKHTSATHHTFISFLNSVSDTGRKTLRVSSRQMLECSKSPVIATWGCDATWKQYLVSQWLHSENDFNSRHKQCLPITGVHMWNWKRKPYFTITSCTVNFMWIGLLQQRILQQSFNLKMPYATARMPKSLCGGQVRSCKLCIVYWKERDIATYRKGRLFLDRSLQLAQHSLA